MSVCDPPRVRGAWSAAEDAALLAAVHHYGGRQWAAVARAIPGRTSKSCRLRWHCHLHPEVNRAPFTRAEDLTIVRCYADMGSKWAQMARKLPGRTDSAIKNRWHTVLKKKKKVEYLDESQTSDLSELTVINSEDFRRSSLSPSESMASPSVQSRCPPSLPPSNPYNCYPTHGFDFPSDKFSIHDSVNGELLGNKIKQSLNMKFENSNEGSTVDNNREGINNRNDDDYNYENDDEDDTWQNLPLLDIEPLPPLQIDEDPEDLKVAEIYEPARSLPSSNFSPQPLCISPIQNLSFQNQDSFFSPPTNHTSQFDSPPVSTFPNLRQNVTFSNLKIPERISGEVEAPSNPQFTFMDLESFAPRSFPQLSPDNKDCGSMFPSPVKENGHCHGVTSLETPYLRGFSSQSNTLETTSKLSATSFQLLSYVAKNKPDYLWKTYDTSNISEGCGINNSTNGSQCSRMPMYFVKPGPNLVA